MTAEATTVPSSFSNSNSNGQKLPPRFARTAEELVFYTDTDQSDYPIFLTPSLELKIKRRPEGVEKFAVFHVKGVEVASYFNGRWMIRGLPVLLPRGGEEVKDLDEYIKLYPQLPLQALFDSARDLKATVYVRAFSLKYEAYRNDYEELVAEAPAAVLAVFLEPPYASARTDAQAFAITYSLLKRLVIKMKDLEKIAYVTKFTGSRTGVWPVVKVKFCLPSPELVNAFEQVKGWLIQAQAGPQTIDQAIAELEKLIAEKERELTELKTKLEELKRLKGVPGRVASLVEVKP